MRFAVCAICRNEGPYLAEWIAWQKALGFDRVFLYDNVSDDGSSEYLAALHEADEITRIHWPREPGVAPQRAAYGDFLQGAALDFDWVLICDLDEFLVLRSGHDLRSFVAAAEAADPQVSALAIPWLIFGSGGAERQAPGLVTERFTRCDPTPAPAVKTMFRPQHAYNFRTHICDLILGDYLDNTFTRPKWSRETPIDLADPQRGQALIHHYFTKSREEWTRRRALGKADRAEEEMRRLAMFDLYHDQKAECRDALEGLAGLRAGIARLEAALAPTAAALDGFGAELLVLNASWLICRITGLAPGTRLRVVLNGQREHVVRNMALMGGGASGFVVNVRWLGAPVESIRIAPLGALRAVTITRDSFLPRRKTLQNLHQYLPQAEQLIFDYFAKLSDTRQGLEAVRALGLRPFGKFLEYGDFIQGVLTHEDDLAAFGRFLAGYGKRHGKAGRQVMARFEAPGHYLADLMRAARAAGQAADRAADRVADRAGHKTRSAG